MWHIRKLGGSSAAERCEVATRVRHRLVPGETNGRHDERIGAQHHGVMRG
jgi:hypothetical protein